MNINNIIKNFIENNQEIDITIIIKIKDVIIIDLKIEIINNIIQEILIIDF